VTAAPGGRCDIRAIDVNKSFGSYHVLRDLCMEVFHGETFVILGASGSGKSVLLKHLAGLLSPDSGRIEILGKDINSLAGEELLALRRRIGMVFQSGALFNSLTVAENVALALEEHRLHSPQRIKEIVSEKLSLVRMEHARDLVPEQISGGMKKRVAVARTLALEPEIILFDEPTLGLDPLMARNVDDLILDLKERVRLTSVVVTHDLASAFLVADRIGMLHEGRIIAAAPPDEFRRIEDEVIQRFIGTGSTWRR